MEKNQEVLAHLIQSQTSIMSQLAQVLTNLDSFSGKGDGGKKKKGEDGDEEVLKNFQSILVQVHNSLPRDRESNRYSGLLKKKDQRDVENKQLNDNFGVGGTKRFQCM